MICNRLDYRRLTRDWTSFDRDVDRALEDSQALFEEQTGRFYERRTRTEVLKLYPDGRVYPNATPIHEVVEPESAVSDGQSILGAESIGLNMFGLWTGRSRYNATVRYSGGYEAGDVPEEVVRAVAEIAKQALSESQVLSTVPAGATSVRVGDVSFAGKNLSGTTELPETVKATIRKWRRRDI